MKPQVEDIHFVDLKQPCETPNNEGFDMKSYRPKGLLFNKAEYITPRDKLEAKFKDMAENEILSYVEMTSLTGFDFITSAGRNKHRGIIFEPVRRKLEASRICLECEQGVGYRKCDPVASLGQGGKWLRSGSRKLGKSIVKTSCSDYARLSKEDQAKFNEQLSSGGLAAFILEKPQRNLTLGHTLQYKSELNVKKMLSIFSDKQNGQD